MNSRIILTIILFSPLFTYAQNIQWASEVLEFSTQLTSIQYSSEQALGKPNVLPRGGESPSSWTPDRFNREDFIKLGFESPMKIRQIAIAESYNPSAIISVSVFDTNGNEFIVGEFEPRKIPLNGRMLNIFYETDYEVSAVKITTNGNVIGEYYSIDAVAISDSETPIAAEVEVIDNVSSSVFADRLDENINSEYKEYKPVLSPDGKTMFFSRKNHPENVGGVDDPEDIWLSDMDEDGNWQEAVNAGPQLNNAGPNFVSSATPDGNSVLLILGNKYLSNGKMESGVSISSNLNGEWSEPESLEIDNDYNFSDKAHYYMANTRKTLLMSVQREDSYGDRDLYVSFMKEDSTWTEPLNLGNVVNTANVEASPFLAADDKSLYFSSNGFSGYGGMDIYVTTRLDDSWTNWSEPRNMGPEINSEFEDSFFNIPANSEYAYYSRGVSEDDTDIFRVELPLFQVPEPTLFVKGNILNAINEDPIYGVINYLRVSDNKNIGIIESNPQTGEYELILPIGEKYTLIAEADDYNNLEHTIDLTEPEPDVMDPVVFNFKLDPIKKEIVFVFNTVQFELNKSALLRPSLLELDRLVEFLNKNEDVHIEIAGHTDTSGEENYNLRLSRKRAESVAKYLKSKGISGSRVETVYFGETKPLESNDTKEGRIKNRRVEFKIINK